jgi:hypothetical protein
MKTPSQKQRALYWQAICLLFAGGEPALIKALHAVANEQKGGAA